MNEKEKNETMVRLTLLAPLVAELTMLVGFFMILVIALQGLAV
jgi:hypothetical protein